jgi:hypothetical protein
MTLLPKDKSLNQIEHEEIGGNQLFPVFLKLNDLHTVLLAAAM